MLNLITVTTIKRDVTLETPTNEIYTIKDVEFTYLPEQDFLALCEAHGDDAINDKIEGWGEFIGSDGEQIEFSEEALGWLMSERWAQISFVTVYAGAIMGADSKNFLASHGLGQLARARAAKRPTSAKKKSVKTSKSSVKRKKRSTRT